MSREPTLPTFQASVPFQVAPEPDISSAIDEQINAFKAVAQVGDEAGAAFDKIEAQNNKSTLQFNVSKAYEGFASEAAKNPNAIEAQANFEKESQAYSSSLAKQTNFMNRGFVQNLTQHYSNQYSTALAKNTLKQASNVAAGQAIVEDDQMGGDIANAFETSAPGPHQFDKAHRLIALRNEYNEKRLAQGTITPAQYKTGLETNQVGYAAHAAGVLFKQKLQTGDLEGANKTLSSIVAGAEKTMPFEQFQKFHAIILKETASYLTDAGVSKKLVVDQYNKSIKSASQNGTQVSAQATQNAISVDPKNAEFYKQTSLNANSLAHWHNFATTATPEQAQAALDSIRPKSKTGPHAAMKWSYYNNANNAYLAGRKQLLDTPAESAAQSLVTRDVAEQQKISQTNGTQHPPSDFTVYATPTPKSVDAIVKWQEAHGFVDIGTKTMPQIQPLFKSTATTFTTNWGKSDTAGKIKLLNDLRQQMGSAKNFSLAIDQLHDHFNLPAGAAWLANTNPASPDGQLIASALTSPMKPLVDQMKHKEISGSDTNILANINKEIYDQVYHMKSTHFFSNKQTILWQQSQQNNAGFGLGDANTNLEASLQKLCYTNYLAGNADSAKALVNLANKQLFNNTQFVQHGGDIWPMPKNNNADLVKLHAENIKSQVSKMSWNLSGSDPTGHYNPEQMKDINQEYINNGRFVTAPSGIGLIFMGANGRTPTLKSTGKPLTFQYADADNYLIADKNFAEEHLEHDSRPMNLYLNNFKHMSKLKKDINLINTVQEDRKKAAAKKAKGAAK